MLIDRPAAAIALPARGGLPVPRFSYTTMVNASFALFITCGAIAIIEPSPYDFASLATMALWFLSGFTITRYVLVFLALIAVYNFGGFVALLPYLNEPDPTLFMLQVYDRVVPSRNGMTLAMLFAMFIFAAATLSMLDFLRSSLLRRASVRLDRLLAQPVLERLLAGDGRVGSANAMRELDTLRQAVTGTGVEAAA